MKEKVKTINIYKQVGDKHGKVQLVDWMGNDKRIVNSARVSFGQDSNIPFDGDPNKPNGDTKLIRYLLKNRHCYDSETEVLTREGFIKWADVKISHHLAIWDPDANTICYETPREVVHFPYVGDMYKVEHEGVDLLVTPEHKMYVQTRTVQKGKAKWKPFELIPAQELGNHSMVRYSKIAPQNTEPYCNWVPFKCDDDFALLELIGFIIGDGYVESNDLVSFNLKKKRKKDYLYELVDRLGDGWILYQRAGGSMIIKHNNFGSWVRSNCYDAKIKKLPENWMLLNKQQASSVLMGLRNSYGSNKRTTWSYSTSSCHLKETLPILGLHAGEAVHVNKTQHNNNRLMFLSRMRKPVINQSRKNTSLVPYSGQVHCATTRTGILIVRRGGKIVLSGNTSPFEHCSITWKFIVPLFVRSQHHRHRTWSFNEKSYRYTSENIVFYEPNYFRTQHEKNRQASKNDKTDPWVSSPFVKGNASNIVKVLSQKMFETYKEMLKHGIAREQARMVLPQNLYTEYYGTVNLHNAFHFLRLRLDEHSQWEIRKVAEAMLEHLKLLFPVATEAFLKDL